MREKGHSQMEAQFDLRALAAEAFGTIAQRKSIPHRKPDTWSMEREFLCLAGGGSDHLGFCPMAQNVCALILIQHTSALKNLFIHCH